MKGMKLIAVAFAVLSMAACSNSSSPGSVAKTFMSGLIHGSFEETSKLAIPSIGEKILIMQKRISADDLAKFIHPNAEVHVDKEVVSKDGAKATVTLSTNVDKSKVAITLIKMGGLWKVANLPGM